MAPLTAFLTCSLDLRVTDAAGGFDWAEPPEDVHRFANERARAVGTHLYGRRMWETMRFWESMPDEPSAMGEYGSIWRAADKVVYSRTLTDVDTARTRLVPAFDPVEVAALKGAATAPLTIGGAELAGQALLAGIVDELELLVVPVLVGAGPRAVPEGLATSLDLVEHRAFDAGWVGLRYAVVGGPDR